MLSQKCSKISFRAVHSFILRFKYLLLFILSLFFIFRFLDISKSMVPSNAHFYTNVIIFIILFLLFFFYIIKLLIIYIKDIKNDKKDFYWNIFILLLSFVTIFFLFDGYATGRIAVLRDILGNVFTTDYFIYPFARTYSMVLYSVLDSFFNITITPLTVLFINRLISCFTLFVIFIISKKLFKKNWIAFIIFISFISHNLVKYNLSSVEYTIGSAFFVYFSFLFIILYSNNNKNDFFILSVISLLLASYYRYELSILFGFSYLLYYSFFLFKVRETRVYMLIATLILINISMAVIVQDFTGDITQELFGEKVDSNSLFLLVQSMSNVLNENIFVYKDLFLDSGFISLFTYCAFIFSIVLILDVINKLINDKDKNDYSSIYLFAFYFIIYNLFLLSVNIRGFRSRWEYSVNNILAEIILAYFLIFWVISKIKINNTFLKKIVQITSILSFLLIALNSSSQLSLDFKPIVEPEIKEMIAMKRSFSIDPSCYILKNNIYHQHLDFYFGLQERSILFTHDNFYESLDKLQKKENCYYYHYPFVSDEAYIYSHVMKVDIDKIDESFKDCIKTIEFESPLKTRCSSIIKYSC